MFQLDLPGKLPGQQLAVPPGQCCDKHPGVAADIRVIEHATAIDCEGGDYCIHCFSNLDPGCKHDACEQCGVHHYLTAVHDPEEGPEGGPYWRCRACNKSNLDSFNADRNPSQGEPE